ncbi:hypothetical protein SPONN_890 [uncultured Candidatus Thioglobus sp.]|nr:hypothetical protein SPONN_890 [uncultured Candidatus Thioglobus sp.]
MKDDTKTSIVTGAKNWTKDALFKTKNTVKDTDKGKDSGRIDTATLLKKEDTSDI